ncbi:DEKNAAC100187 [Brettanomyces naardenensis]|uniref:DEKNAAC100187 n=1 Tax=Brettanomyces naardenensis TaxID=13370 RepID=A0A448YEY6_BRENA|nr:DEKNAAC100187 [Brettanomyces naardenensis]
MAKKQIRVGVLALQGSFREHLSHLSKLFEELAKSEDYSEYEFKDVAVRTAKDLEGLSGIIICGGESTTMSILLQRKHLLNPLRQLIREDHLPAWGTCCGLILLSNRVTNNTSLKLGDLKYEVIGGLDATVDRNSFGRQIDSFTETIDLSGATGEEIHDFNCVFIRAPVISGLGNARSLAKIKRNDTELIVAVRNDTVLGTSFHPELVDGDYRFHKWFIDEFVLT